MMLVQLREFVFGGVPFLGLIHFRFIDVQVMPLAVHHRQQELR